MRIMGHFWSANTVLSSSLLINCEMIKLEQEPKGFVESKYCDCDPVGDVDGEFFFYIQLFASVARTSL